MIVAAAQADTRDLAQGGVRLLRGGGVDAGADTTTLRRALEGGSLVLAYLVGAALMPILCFSNTSFFSFIVFNEFSLQHKAYSINSQNSLRLLP